MKRFLSILFFVPLFSFTPDENKFTLADFAKYFEGTWEADQASCTGIGSGTRNYQYILNKTYLEVTNHAQFPNPDSTKAADTHDDKGIYSYDKSRKKIVHREFNSEGFINQYVLDSISPDKKTLVFLTEAIENVPKGWQGRITLTIIDENKFTDHFELKKPNGEFKTYVRANWIRKK